MKELEDCLKKLDRGVSRKRRNWFTQQKAEVNKLELGSQLKRSLVAGSLRGSDENTFVRIAIDGKSLRWNSGSASKCEILGGSHYPLHMAMVEVSSQRILVDKAFSVS